MSISETKVSSMLPGCERIFLFASNVASFRLAAEPPPCSTVCEASLIRSSFSKAKSAGVRIYRACWVSIEGPKVESDIPSM